MQHCSPKFGGHSASSLKVPLVTSGRCWLVILGQVWCLKDPTGQWLAVHFLHLKGSLGLLSLVVPCMLFSSCVLWTMLALTADLCVFLYYTGSHWHVWCMSAVGCGGYSPAGRSMPLIQEHTLSSCTAYAHIHCYLIDKLLNVDVRLWFRVGLGDPQRCIV